LSRSSVAGFECNQGSATVRDIRTIALSTTTIRTRTLGDVAVVEVAGEVDLASGGSLLAVLTAQFDQHYTGVVVDLTETVFFGSTGIAALLRTAALAREHGIDMAVVADHRAVLRPLQLTGVDQELRIRPSVDLALAELAGNPPSANRWDEVMVDHEHDSHEPRVGWLLHKVDEVTGALEQLAEALNREENVAVLLQRTCQHALQVIPQANMASVSLVRDDGADSVAMTDDHAVEIDEAQYASGEGPCLEAAKTGQVVRVTVSDIRDKWPAFADVAGKAAVASYLSAPLFIDSEYQGSLNLYGEGSHGFGELDAALLELYVTAAEAALRSARRWLEARELAENLRTALTSRAVIDQAKGIVMATRRVTADEAFTRLVEQSQNENVKVRDLAQRFVDETIDATDDAQRKKAQS
jgi:anti-anti-sigma factor